MWDAWLNAMASATSRVPLAVLRGNHEEGGIWQSGDSGGECGVVSSALLPAPAPGSVGYDPRELAATPGWWSLDVGKLHLVGIATEAAIEANTPQYAWLSRDLFSVDRNITPWVVLLTHRPLLVDSTDVASRLGGSDQEVASKLRQVLEPLLWAARVNLVISGHNHAVQRHSSALRGSPVSVADGATSHVAWQRTAHAPVYLVWGTGGAPFTRNANGAASTVERVIYRAGYGVVSAVNATHLRADWIASDDGRTVDTVWLTQPEDAATNVWNWPVANAEVAALGGTTSDVVVQLSSIELAIVVAVIFIVAAVGIVMYRRLMLRRMYEPIEPAVGPTARSEAARAENQAA